jgi:hypothetical protein
MEQHCVLHNVRILTVAAINYDCRLRYATSKVEYVNEGGMKEQVRQATCLAAELSKH